MPEPNSQWQQLSGQPNYAGRSPRRSWAQLRPVLVRGAALGVLGSLFALLLLVVVALGIYAYYALQLPSPQELYQRSAEFKSTKIYDRHGHVLYEIIDPLGGRRTLVPYERIPQTVIQAVVATEDASFFSNPGLDPLAILRALYQDLRAGEIVQGGSTITQQLVKNLYLSHERTLARKLQEAILAAEITRRYEKSEILEVYLNEAYFGNLAYGIGAAAETYFGKKVEELDLAEGALLAGLLQSPALYDPYLYPQAALMRRSTALRLMYEKGLISRTAYDVANLQPLDLADREIVMDAPHFVVAVREELERLYGAEMLYKGGLQVYTTLDLEQQYLAEQVARERIASLRERGASNTALMALDPHNGDVLALVGSVDFDDATIGGQVDVTRRLRQPGSTIKPLTYLAALERGWTPSTLLMDVAQDFPDGANPPYRPHNHDGEEWGPISLRTALACSRNIPAVSTLYQIGLPALIEMGQRLGIASLNRPDYGLSLTLGGGDITLWELTAAYGALANGGLRVVPRTILYIEDQSGHMLQAEQDPQAPRVLDARHAYLITDILADRDARRRAFGAQSALELSFPAAVKTGTTNDYRDSWTVGYTPDLVVGVWVGNNDNTPMDRLSGSGGAATIWHDFMERALGAATPALFERPEGIIEVLVCPISGGAHTVYCPPAQQELFLVDAPPPPCTLHRRVAICEVSGQLATEYCPSQHVHEHAVEDYGESWDAWAKSQGIVTPPRETCQLHSFPVDVTINASSDRVSGILDLYGSTMIGDFAYYWIEWGEGHEPDRWRAITSRVSSPVDGGVLARWDTRSVSDGRYTLRLRVHDHHDGAYEARLTVDVANPRPSASYTAIPSPSVTGTHTLTPWPTSTIVVWYTPTPSPTRTLWQSPVPSLAASPTLQATVPTLVPSLTLTPTPTDTSRPSVTPEPSATLSPTLELTPWASPEPTQAVAPTRTPPPLPGLPRTGPGRNYPAPSKTPES
ncbi:MAG: penicillin-binding protein 1C [Anaerolineae bacterium]|nr:penicillin-binding protein 1C [Anaerolineae bacterium]